MRKLLKRGLVGNSFPKNKRALSEIVATLITILLVLVAVGIIWVVVRNVIQQGSEQISLGKLTLSLKIKQVQANETNAIVKVMRNSGEGNITGIKFIFDDEENTEFIEKQGGLNELQERTYYFALTKINGSNLKKVSIAPVFRLESGKEVTGDVSDKLEITKTHLTSNLTTCTPNCVGKNCGSNGCSGTCGSCLGGQICNSTGQCTSTGIPTWQNGLILWLKLNGEALDSSSFAWSTTDNAVTYSTGKIGQAATGFSETQKIDIDSDLDFALTDMTISFWMNMRDYVTPNRQNPIGKAYGGDGSFTIESNGNINFYFGGSGSNNQPYTQAGSGSSAIEGVWEHWAITRNRATRQIQWYKNGVASGDVFTYNSTYDPVHSDYSLTIGDNYRDPLNGTIDEVMIWNRSLSASEVSQVYSYTY